MPTPEALARQRIDALLAAAGWAVQDVAAAQLGVARGVALREFPLDAGHGTADYLLYVDNRAAGVIEAKPAGATLTGVEWQSGRYARGLPAALPAWRRPLPFVYESSGNETRFTNGGGTGRNAQPTPRRVDIASGQGGARATASGTVHSRKQRATWPLGMFLEPHR